MLETLLRVPALVLVVTLVSDVEFEVVVLIKPPGFGAGVEDNPAPPLVVTVGVLVSTTAGADALDVVELSAAVPVAKFVQNPGNQKSKSVLSLGKALEHPATALSYAAGK